MRRLRVGVEPISGVEIQPSKWRKIPTAELDSWLFLSEGNPINEAVNLIGTWSGSVTYQQIGCVNSSEGKTHQQSAIRVSEWGKSQQRSWHWQRETARGHPPLGQIRRARRLMFVFPSRGDLSAKHQTGTLRGGNLRNKVWTPNGVEPTVEDFDCLWANREGARRLVLALPPPSGVKPINGECKHWFTSGSETH